MNLPAYSGYNASVNPGLSNEFATVGYRAHSQIHGEALEADAEVSRYSQATLDSLEAQGVEVTIDGDEVGIVIPLNVAFFNPDLVEQIQLGPVLAGIGAESEYKNDELIDNQLRSVLFQVPVSGNPECLDGPTLPQCFSGVVDLGAIDIAARPRPRHAELQPDAAGLRAAGEGPRSRRSPARRPTPSRTTRC